MDDERVDGGGVPVGTVTRKYRKHALAVLAAAALATVVPPATGTAGSRQTRGASHVARGALGSRRGRPRKFNRPARSVTLTLPEDVIAALQAIDTDLSRALVRAVQPLMPGSLRPAAELMTYGGSAVISVTPSAALRTRLGVEFVPLHDGQALVAFDSDVTPEQLELRVRDALAGPSASRSDRTVLEALAAVLQSSRQRNGVVLRQRGIIVLHLPEIGAGFSPEEA